MERRECSPAISIGQPKAQSIEAREVDRFEKEFESELKKLKSFEEKKGYIDDLILKIEDKFLDKLSFLLNQQYIQTHSDEDEREYYSKKHKEVSQRKIDSLRDTTTPDSVRGYAR